MARARNIKPSFFTSEQVADNCFAGRLLFIGLWTLADFKGEMEWRPRTIKAKLFPFDDVDVVQLAINLDKSGLIRFYSDGERVLLNIPNFDRHQNPHINERKKGTDIPPFADEMRQAVDLQKLTINRDSSRVVPERSQSDPADSCFLIPDSLLPDSRSLKPSTPAAAGSGQAAPKPARAKSERKTAACWKAYEDAYRDRYGVPPTRNATVNGQMARVVDRLGIEEAPLVAGFYVHHNSSYYVAQGHSVGALLRDAEKLRTEWATGRKMTQTTARQVDKTASNPFAKILTEQRS